MFNESKESGIPQFKVAFPQTSSSDIRWFMLASGSVALESCFVYPGDGLGVIFLP